MPVQISPSLTHVAKRPCRGCPRHPSRRLDPSRVPPMCLADRATQALGDPRDNDQVSMIGHQAICPARDLLCAAECRHELEVALVDFLTEERLLSEVSPLGGMVGHARRYHSCQSSHGGKLTSPQPHVKSYVWCPWNFNGVPGTSTGSVMSDRATILDRHRGRRDMPFPHGSSTPWPDPVMLMGLPSTSAPTSPGEQPP